MKNKDGEYEYNYHAKLQAQQEQQRKAQAEAERAARSGSPDRLGLEPFSFERTVYDNALMVLYRNCEADHRYEPERVELAKWIVLNIWGPTE
jgi:hypothetical protein